MNTNFQGITPGDELLKELAEATEYKTDGFSDNDFNQVDPQPVTPSADDFFQPAASEQIPEMDPAEEQPPIDYKEQAKLIIAFADGIQCLTLPIVYQQVYFSGEEREKLKDLKSRMEGDQPQAVLTQQDQELYGKYSEVSKLTQELPFTEKEINLITDPLAAVMEKYKFKASAETLLMGAIFTVMAPRLAPLLITFNK